MRLNRHYLRVSENYLFTAVAQKVQAYQQQHPTQPLIKLSIGDVSQPLPACIVDALVQASREQGQAATFRGYGAETGDPELKAALANYYRTQWQVNLQPTEICISDGAKSDLANILDLFAPKCRVIMVDPGYPVYYETNVLGGRNPRLLAATRANHFLPLPKAKLKADLIYLCNPANPTGVCYTRAQLQQWVDCALRQKAIIIYDAAYTSFITDAQLPHSIYQLDGAKECAIEICSLSKMAGFTGIRCGYTVIPQSLQRDGVSLLKLWTRRQSVKFNGASCLAQRGALAVFTPTGLRAVHQKIVYYQRNLRLLRRTLDRLGWFYVGGVQAPYLWVACPADQTAWQFFDELLTKTGIVCTPGVGFGAAGEHYIRLTGFNTYAQTQAACRQLLKAFGHASPAV